MGGTEPGASGPTATIAIDAASSPADSVDSAWLCTTLRLLFRGDFGRVSRSGSSAGFLSTVTLSFVDLVSGDARPKSFCRAANALTAEMGGQCGK